MKKIFRKNQVIITALALMIAVAGYLQYTGKLNDKDAAKEAGTGSSEDTYDVTDGDLFNANDIFTDTEDNSAAASADGTAGGGEAAQTDPAQTGTDPIDNPGEAVLTSSNVENLNFAAEVKLNREQIRSKNKDSTNVVVSITDDKADVVLNMGDVTDAKRAQVEDIVKRKTNIAGENIVITPIQVKEK